eukprot:526808_1
MHLQIATQTFLFGEILYAWDAIGFVNIFQSSTYLWRTFLDVSRVVIILILYISNVSLISECYQKFEKVFWFKGKHYLITNDTDFNNKTCYNYILQYIQKYPMCVKLGTFSVTKLNTIKFIGIFLVSKILATAVSTIIKNQYSR